MAVTVTPGEEAQLLQTIEMFEVITQSQPHDFQSLEILKEAYAKLEREEDVVRTAKRIAHVYVHLGQISSAILEYESILQRHPDDAEVLAALGEIESKASLGNEAERGELPDPPRAKPPPVAPKSATVSGARQARPDLDDGRQEFSKLYVESRFINLAQFEECWAKPEWTGAPSKPVDPFIQVLASKNLVAVEKSLRLLSDRARMGFIPLDKYEIDLDLARTFPAEICCRWCVLPFDRMSKSVLVATCNPFNRQAAAEMADFVKKRLIWYLAPPQDILGALRKLHR